MKSCSFCLELIDISMISYCTNCVESGNTCHSCENRWVEQGKDPNICTICRQNTKENISEMALIKYNRHQNPLYIASHIRPVPFTEPNVVRPIVRVRIYRQYLEELRCMICMFMTIIFTILFIGLIINISLASKRNK